MRIVLSKHAVQRYVDRVRPGLDTGRAAAELETLLRVGEFVERPPAWAADARVTQTTVGWVLLTDGVAMPVEQKLGHMLAMTVVTRGGMTPERRARRNAKAKRRREIRRARHAREKSARNRGRKEL